MFTVLVFGTNMRTIFIEYRRVLLYCIMQSSCDPIINLVIGKTVADPKFATLQHCLALLSDLLVLPNNHNESSQFNADFAVSRFAIGDHSSKEI